MGQVRASSLLLLLLAYGCDSPPVPGGTDAAAGPRIETAPDFEPAPLVVRDFRDASAPSQSAGASAAPPAASPEAAPREAALGGLGYPALAATAIATTVYQHPDRTSARLGYLRIGGVVRRAEQPVSGRGCPAFWYPIQPIGYVCTDEATLDLESPLVRAAARRPKTDQPLPYAYGFVRATAPQYLRIPTHAEQAESELELLEHLAWFTENRLNVQRVSLGANDVPLDARGMVRLGQALPEGLRLSTQLEPNELYGGGPGAGQVPFWLRDGRQIPNVSGFDVPRYAAFADRVRRKTGLSFVDSFEVEDAGYRRGFGVTVDLRLIPTSKVKPDSGTQFHGVEMGRGVEFPFSIVIKRDARGYQLIRGQDSTKPGEALPHRALIPMSGGVRFKAGRRFYQTRRDPRLWLAGSDVAYFAPPASFPKEAERGKKWIDVSLVQQTLVLYAGKDAKYATLISSGQERLGDPRTEKATPLGHFEIESKHIAAAMDSEENSSLLGGVKTERVLIGVTHRRGGSTFELRDVPWIQYFDAGYALHGAYWHDVFGVPRSHGCINLSPIDARVVFNWTEPPLPEGWHGFNVSGEFGPGTAVVIRE